MQGRCDPEHRSTKNCIKYKEAMQELHTQDSKMHRVMIHHWHHPRCVCCVTVAAESSAARDLHWNVHCSSQL